MALMSRCLQYNYINVCRNFLYRVFPILMENVENGTEYPLRPRVMLDIHCTDFQEIITMILSGDFMYRHSPK